MAKFRCAHCGHEENLGIRDILEIGRPACVRCTDTYGRIVLLELTEELQSLEMLTCPKCRGTELSDFLCQENSWSGFECQKCGYVGPTEHFEICDHRCYDCQVINSPDEIDRDGCPYCGGEPSFEDVEVDSMEARQKAICIECQEEWFEIYKFSHVEKKLTLTNLTLIASGQKL